VGDLGWWVLLIAAAWLELSIVAAIVIALIASHGRARAQDKHRQPADPERQLWSVSRIR